MQNLCLSYELSEDKTYAKIKVDMRILNKLITRGLYDPFNDKIYKIMKKYEEKDTFAFGYYYLVTKIINLQSIGSETPSIEMCEELNDLFNMVIPYESGRIVWLFLKEEQ